MEGYTEQILCLVVLCLLGWVYVLKTEIEEIKRETGTRSPSGSDGVISAKRSGSQKGGRSFELKG